MSKDKPRQLEIPNYSRTPHILGNSIWCEYTESCVCSDSNCDRILLNNNNISLHYCWMKSNTCVLLILGFRFQILSHLIKRKTARRHDSCLPLRQITIASSILSSLSCMNYSKDIISRLILISRWELWPVTEN